MASVTDPQKHIVHPSGIVLDSPAGVIPTSSADAPQLSSKMSPNSAGKLFQPVQVVTSTGVHFANPS